MKFWRVVLIGSCLLVSGCTGIRSFYEAVYNTLQFRAQAKNLPDETPFHDAPISFQQYEAERKTLLESPDNDKWGRPDATRVPRLPVLP